MLEIWHPIPLADAQDQRIAFSHETRVLCGLDCDGLGGVLASARWGTDQGQELR